jgi:hypothetical protein
MVQFVKIIAGHFEAVRNVRNSLPVAQKRIKAGEQKSYEYTLGVAHGTGGCEKR